MWKNRISVELEYLQKEQNQTIAGIVNNLPVKYREVLWLYYYMELSITEFVKR